MRIFCKIFLNGFMKNVIEGCVNQKQRSVRATGWKYSSPVWSPYQPFYVKLIKSWSTISFISAFCPQCKSFYTYRTWLRYHFSRSFYRGPVTEQRKSAVSDQTAERSTRHSHCDRNANTAARFAICSLEKKLLLIDRMNLTKTRKVVEHWADFYRKRHESFFLSKMALIARDLLHQLCSNDYTYED